MPFQNPAPGWPGIPARWTSSAKSGVGTALTARSRVWFTVSHGILNEIYYPRIDQACTRDFGFIVTDRQGFFSEEKRDTESIIRPIDDGVPAFAISSTCSKGRYRLDKLVLSDPQRDVVLQRVTFHALTGKNADYRLYALLAPHLVNRGAGNSAWVDSYKGVPMLFAEGSGTALAVACSVPFLARSAGFVGTSDGWQDLCRHYELRWNYDHARNGNVALVGEVDLLSSAGSVVLALGFGQHVEEAALRVRSSLSGSVESAVADYAAGWRAWQDSLLPLDPAPRPDRQNPYRVSTAVLRAHEANSFAGGYIASLSIPWGFAKGDEDLGGYHLVWPRDLVETAGGLLAAGAQEEVRQIIRYLQAIQEEDGHWPQNCWLDGTPYWNGVQMDECAFPILLVDLAWRDGALPETELRRLWSMVKPAAGFILRNGPVTGQDRWEEDGGYSPFTLAVEIAALLAAADLADKMAEPEQAMYLRETADLWNSLIERWIYATGTSLAKDFGVDGYYVRIAPPETADAASPLEGFVPIKNRPPRDSAQRASLIVSPDALALVRFGLRAPDDPRIRNTVKVIDALLKADLPAALGRKRCSLPSKVSPATATSFPSRCGMHRISPNGNSSSADPPARRCRLSGRMPSTSSCCALSRMAVSSICRRNRGSATRSTESVRATPSGASIINAAIWRQAGSCGSNSRQSPRCIGARMDGKLLTIRRRGIAVSVSTLPTSIRRSSRPAARSSSPSAGPPTAAGRASITNWQSTDCRYPA